MDSASDDDYEFMKPVWTKNVCTTQRERFEALSSHVNKHFNRRSVIPLYVDAILNSAKAGRITEKQLEKLEQFVMKKQR